MAAALRSLAITDAYRERSVALRGAVLVGVTQAWGLVRVDDLDRTGRDAVRLARSVVEAGAAQAAALAGVYLQAFVTSELGRRVSVPAVRVPELDGGDLASAVIASKVAAGYRRPRNEILAGGLVRARTIASWQIASAARRSLLEAMVGTERIIGWRRATSGAPCGACLAAATGAIRDTDEVPEAHTHCQCVAEPVVSGVSDAHPRPTGQQIFDGLTTEQQDRLFHGHGGAEKADLIRSGQVPLSRLISTSEMATADGQITETPLAALRR